MTRLERIRGCLLGGSVGDALGAPVEFLDWSAIQQKYGPSGIRDLDQAYGVMGAITDDTQMMLFTAEGLLRAHVRQVSHGIPARWLEALELHDVIDQVAADIDWVPRVYEGGSDTQDSDAQIWRRYPGW
ncbi:ADP-ribosylglycohydrolase family protein [Pseudomonas schmalbachii]|uniref:ADP-ribosylglycohydrolase family protein n=1 Tax=Pseudomonas schmalbachii TaxID=2816993 RepID=A0ABS3TKC9_9PSED|nr:ADP-ribosylglycohydrolase family protein [Pseudomonas schmalbachii]MBO3274112.1 ADP-ribosylglycohydrolase family protein [Pseudomonas schmalbachii]